MAGGGATIHFNRAAFPPNGPDAYVMAGLRAVTPTYLATLGVPLRHGRLLTEQDREEAPRVVVINESMARQFFPDLDPIGRELRIRGQVFQVIGVIEKQGSVFGFSLDRLVIAPYTSPMQRVIQGRWKSALDEYAATELP